MSGELGDWQPSPVLYSELGIWYLGVFDPGSGYGKERRMKESKVEMGLCVLLPPLFPLCFLNREETSDAFKMLHLK